jgi:hypothetical protein
VLDNYAGETRKVGPARLTHYPSARAGRPLRNRRRTSVARRGLRALAVVVLLLVIVVVAAAAIIISGPTEVSIIRDRVQTLLEHGLGPDYHVDVGRSTVNFDPALGLVAEIDDIAVHDSHDAIVARVPSTRLAIDPFALLRLRVEVSTVELSNAELGFVHSRDGEVYLGNADTVHTAKARSAPAQPDRTRELSAVGFPDILAGLQFIDHGIAPSIDAAVKAGFLRFALVGGTISIWNAEKGQERRFAGTDVNVAVDADTSDLDINVASSGYGGKWTATFLRQLDPASGKRALSAEFQQITLADLFPELAAATSEVTADIPLFARATAHFAADGSIEEASTQLNVGAGTITFGEQHEKMLLDEASLKIRWDIPNNTVVIDPSPIVFGDTHGTVTGWIKPDGKAGSRHYTFDIESKGAVIAPPDSTEGPLVADRIGIAGKLDLPNNLLVLDDASLVTPVGSVAAAGSIGIGGPSPMVSLEATFSPMEASALKQIWAPFIAWGARHWVLQHVNDGKLTAGRFDANLPVSFIFARNKPPITDENLRLDIDFEDGEFTSYGELPPVKHAYGSAVLSGSAFKVSLDKGEVATSAGGLVTVDSGSFSVANTFLRGGAEGQIEGELSGDAAGIGEIANSKPFLALQRRQLNPSDLSGPVNASVSVTTPLRPGVTEAEVNWKVSVTGKGIASKAPIEGRTFSDADVTITASPEAVSIKGKAKINGVPADVALTQPLGQGGAVSGPGERTARLTLDDAARKRLGIGLDQVLGGTVDLQISNIEDGSKGQHYDLDLRRAKVVMPGLGWAKAIGVPATLTFDVKPVEGGNSVENIHLDGADFGFTGTAKLDSGLSLVSADLDHFSLHPGDSLAFQLTRTKTGYGIVAHGASFDLKGVLDQLENNGDHDVTAPDVTIDARVDRLTGFNQQVIAGARLTMASGGGYVHQHNIAGAIGGADLKVAYSDTSQGASLLVSSEDAGNVLRYINLYTRVDGGRLSITGQRDGAEGPMIGSLEVINFNLMNEQAVSQIATPRPGGPTVNLSHAHFDRLVARFQKLDRRINIDDGLLRGSNTGATFNGRFDLAASRMAINGTLIPAYDFNDALGHIPIVGMILTGGVGGGGIFGLTFRIEGSLNGAHFIVNPLSVVAPGIFRKIFEFH